MDINRSAGTRRELLAGASAHGGRDARARRWRPREEAAVSGFVRDHLDVPEQRVGNDSVAVRDVIDARDGCELFTLRTLTAVAGRSIARPSGDAEELLFVLAGRGRLIAADGEHALEPETGVLVRAGERYELDNDGPDDLSIVAVVLHRPLPRDGGEVTARTPVSHLADLTAQTATADREFRIVHDPASGCPSATQFVGYIPVGRAPEHYHLYDEVIYILDGNGVMHMHGAQTPLSGGSVINLPARTLHILENSGPGVMRVLGIFRPAGSPAAAFYPDGTPATYGITPAPAGLAT